MATRGWEVSRCFLNNRSRKHIVFAIFLHMNEDTNIMNQSNLEYLTNVEEARKAFIASEVFNRKY